MSRSSHSTSANFARSSSESTTRNVNSSPAANLKQQQPTHSSSSESHTPTQRAESEDSGTRNDKETDNGTSTKEAQLAERHLSTERPPNTRSHRAGVSTPRYDQKTIKMQRLLLQQGQTRRWQAAPVTITHSTQLTLQKPRRGTQQVSHTRIEP